MRGGHSLRGRILGVMALVFAFGVVAALLSYRHEVRGHADSLRKITLQQQARELAAALSVGADGTPHFALSPRRAEAYADPSRDFIYTLYDPAGRPLGPVRA